jgi:hypothetical protein
MDDVIYQSEVKTIVAVTPLENYSLLLEFSNGEKRIADITDLLAKPVYQPLKNKAFFQKVHIVHNYTIAWNDEIDMCPDSLYLNSKAYIQ